RGLVDLVRRLRAARFDVAIAAHKSVRTALALRAVGIPRRIGFAAAPAAALYTDRVERPPALHDRDRLLGLLAPLGITALDPELLRPRIALDEGTRARARALLASHVAVGRPFA